MLDQFEHTWIEKMEQQLRENPAVAVALLQNAATDASPAMFAHIEYLLAQCYRKLHQQQNEETALLNCIQFFKTVADKEHYYFCNIGLAKVNANFGRYAIAETYLSAAQDLANEAQNCEWMIRVYDNLGLLNSRMSRYEESVRYYTEALRLLRSNAGSKQLQSMKTNVYLGNVYIKMKLYDRAYDHFTMALTELQADFNSYDSQMPLRGLAYLFLDQKKPEAAKRFLDKAHQQLETKGDLISKMRLTLLDAEYLKQMGAYLEAKELLTAGLQLFHQQEVAFLKVQYLKAIAELEKQVAG